MSPKVIKQKTTPKATKGKSKGNGGEARPSSGNEARPALKRAKVEESDGSPPAKVVKNTILDNVDINVKMQNWLSDILKHPVIGSEILEAAPLTVKEGGKQAPLVVEDFDRALAGTSAGSRNAFYAAGQ